MLSTTDDQPATNQNYRIGVFSWESLYSFRVGGLATAVTELCHTLEDRGHDVHLFTRMGDYQSDYDKIDGLHVHRCSFPYTNNILEMAHNMCEAMVERFHYTEDMVGKFDVIHGHDWMTVDALHRLENKGYPTVLTYHSTEFGRNGGVFGDWWEFDAISGKEWYGGYIADKVTTLSTAMKSELMWLYDIPEWKIRVVPNGGCVGEHKKDVVPGRVKERYGIHPLAPTILYIGRLEYQKGPDLLVKAIPQVLDHRWDAEFLIAGKGGMRDHLEWLVHDLGISESVHILGFIPDEEYIDILNACDIVCIPSRHEPFGLVLLEAWDAEKGVVATNVGGLNDNIDNFENGILVHRYPESIAWGINYIIDDPVGIKTLGKEGKEKLKELAWPIVASKYEKAYKETLSKQ